MDVLTRALVRPRRVARPLCQCLQLHTSSSRRLATPLPNPSVPGPPPETPVPAASDALDRVARKRKQAELLKQAREIKASPSRPKTLLAKRFWKDVAVRETPDGLQVFLDSRPVRTPSKEILTVPRSKPHLAAGIALEWDLLHSAQQALKTHYIPLTSLAARALDIEKADAAGETNVRSDIIRMLMRYLSTDTLLCWAPEKNLHDAPQDTASLRKLQMDVARPIISYLTTFVWPSVEIKPILEPDSIMPVSQPQQTQAVVREWLSKLPAYELAGLERAVLGSKSLLVGARLVHEWSEAFPQYWPPLRKPFGMEEAAEASSLEVRWQTEQWGEVEDTHDVEKEDLRRQLGSVIVLVSGDAA